jgi:NADP-dependent 3-hydroxy acid dehydrogenase YdfG
MNGNERMTTNNSRKAIVTGAGSGIGREVSRELVAQGWTVLGVDLQLDRVQALEKETNGKVIPLQADISHDGISQKIMSVAEKKMGGLDLLVNNAGTSWVGQFEDMSVEKIDTVLNVNVRALILLCQQAIGLLKKSSSGQIINIASIAAQVPMETLALYCSSKAAVSMFSKVLAKELAEDKIRVNSFCPTGTDTELFQKVGVDIDRDTLVSATDMAKTIVNLTTLPESVEMGEVIMQKRFVP